MRKKTFYTKNQIIEIVSKYTLGKYLRHKQFSEGNVNSHIRIETDKGIFVLRVYESKEPKEISAEIALLKHLASNDFPCPKPIPHTPNKYILKYAAKYVVMYSFIQGTHIKQPNNYQLGSAARTLATLHNVTADFRLQSLKSKTPNPIDSAHDNIKLAKHVAKTQGIDITLNLEFLHNRLSHIKTPRNLRKGICHGDPDWNNMLFSGNSLVGLIDFDSAKDDILISDVTSFVGIFCLDAEKEFDYQKARIIIDEYQRIRPLNSIEKKYFYEILELNYIWWFSHKLTNEEHIKKNSFKLLPEAKPFKKLDKINREVFYANLFT